MTIQIMKKLFLAATALALATTTSALAGDLNCGQPKVLLGDEPDTNPVVSVEVSYRQEDHAWRIFHHMANGQVVSRGEQYAITDWTTTNKTQWTGSLNRNRSLYMIGEVKKNAKGEIVYWEWLYDRAKANALVMQMGTLCQLNRPPLEKPTSQAAPPPIAFAERYPTGVLPPMITQPSAPVEAMDNPWLVPAGPTGPKIIQTVPVVPVKERDAVRLYPHASGKAALVDVLIGGQPLRMMLDTGAMMSQINTDLATTIVGQGQGSWGDMGTFVMADGSKQKQPTIIVKEIRIGKHVVKNVTVSVSNGTTPLLAFPVVNEIGPFTVNTRTNELIWN